MANVFIENATLQNIANAIRNKTGKTEKILPAEMPVEIESIQANSGGYEKGFADGKLAALQAEYDAFWDEYQDYGNRTTYQYAFSGSYWNDKTFKPKYDIILSVGNNGYLMFQQSNITDLEKALGGKKLDVSVADSSVFNSASNMTVIPEVTATRGTNSWFRGCSSLETIRKIILANNSNDFYNTFVGCSKLKNVIFEGVIFQSISFSASPLLSGESIDNIIGCLKDLTGGTAETLTFHATVGGNLTDTQKATITAKNWTLVY